MSTGMSKVLRMGVLVPGRVWVVCKFEETCEDNWPVQDERSPRFRSVCRTTLSSSMNQHVQQQAAVRNHFGRSSARMK